MRHKYSIWKPKENSRPTLIITDDGGKTYTKVAVFSNDESVRTFEKWFISTIIEASEPIDGGNK